MARRTHRRCTEVTPNRFQYGKFFLEKVSGGYKCEECGIVTKSAKDLKNRKQHILRHIMDQHENPSRAYVCKDCGMVYNNRSSLRAYKINKHQSPSDQFPCSDCGAVFGNSIEAISHRRTVHRQLYRKKFFCEICGKVFNQKGFLDDHVAFVHNGRKMNECKVCDKKFSSRRGLKLHQNNHTEQSTYNCDICGMTFNKNYLFTRHKKLICRPESMGTSAASPSINVYNDNWLPKKFALPKFSQLVKRVSESEFIYKDKYSFQGTEVGFKCGLCPLIIMFCPNKKSAPWFNIIKHFKRRHMSIDEHNSRITRSSQQRCIEVAPNRFQYGKYVVEEVDGLYKCGECGAASKPAAKPHKMQYILKHIKNQHENASTTYVCEYCGVAYNAPGSLTVHKITKHGDPNGRFPCSECGKVFRNRVAAMGHRHSVHSKNPKNNFICETCRKKFSRKDLLEGHLAFVHKGLKLHDCEECGKKFGTSAALKNHQNTHPGNRKYIYNISAIQSVEENHADAIASIEEDTEVNSLAQVARMPESEDVAQSHDETRLASKVDGGPPIKAFKNNWLPKSLTMKSSRLVKQVSETDFIYKGEYPFQGTEFGFKCGFCPNVVSFCTYKTSAPWENLTKHMKKHHVGDPKVQTNRTVPQTCIEVAPNRFQYGKYSFEKVDGMFKCGECGVLKKASGPYAGRHQNIRKHIMEKHENPSRTYVCNYCGAVYKNRKNLSIHKTSKHVSPNGQFPCSVCGKIFGSRVAATRHRNNVHRSKRFICEVCGKNFRLRHAMKDHVAFVHNGQQEHECEECGKNFASRTALKIHKNNHTGRRKYSCDICGMDFTQQQSIKRHKKTAHGADK